MLKVLDLPAPFGPNNPKIEPSFTPNEFPHTAYKPFEYVLTICCAAIGQTVPGWVNSNSCR